MLRKLKYIIPAVLLMTSCKKQLDINTNPYAPTAVTEAHLLTGIERGLGNATSQNGLSYALEVYTHRITVREAPNGYGLTGNDISWGDFYVTVLTNTDFLIAEGTKNGNLQYAGIGEIIKAYAYSLLVDVYGDVPYSEVNKLVSDKITNPKFDKGSEIYPQLITLLNKGIADLNASASNVKKPGVDDLIYGGSIAKWEKAANSIKLKLLLQQRKIKNVTADVNALIATNKLISTTAESFLLPHGPNGATDDRNAGFSEYYASQRTKNVSPWFYEILKGYNPKIYTGITDPRVPYYIYNQLRTASTTTPNPSEYRDGRFLSIYFGSTGPNAGQSQQNYMSLSGIYPVGGRYDDGQGGTATAASGTGAAPDRFITYADVLFMQAELINTGVITGNARTTFQAAVNEAFKQVDYVITTYVKPTTQTVPALVGASATNAYITAVMAQFDAKPAQQLEQILTQKWISSFGFAVDAYTDNRRTGFPVMFDPSNTEQAPGGRVQPPVSGNPSQPVQPSVPVQATKKFPLTLPWPQDELNSNSNAPAQKVDPSTYKPFWLP
ncbi:SusD/RagB family nutrient-binding outer membrane lipoprotein [Mucilaginibacter terrae]|uniref:SusD/RagB family nutrient-binding outer membrane lipoprotein n=1 Tax=Mucilaginibacter terrae TaxID=1955052 RepID=A0ABU3GWF7_9SPHI|nr:SusD/RagB family nutrient-binding outer membrane lipoprotein [Mucilaginibacter terrae]MDT3402980.1 hypothetical protein [Mucilaginibacter terrae]